MFVRRIPSTSGMCDVWQYIVNLISHMVFLCIHDFVLSEQNSGFCFVDSEFDSSMAVLPSASFYRVSFSLALFLELLELCLKSCLLVSLEFLSFRFQSYLAASEEMMKLIGF